MSGRSGSDRVRDVLRASGPALDDLRRARLERQLVESLEAVSTARVEPSPLESSLLASSSLERSSVETALIEESSAGAPELRVSPESRRRPGWTRHRVAIGIGIAAAAAIAASYALVVVTSGPEASEPAASFQTYHGGDRVRRGPILEGERVDTGHEERVEVAVRAWTGGPSVGLVDIPPSSRVRFESMRRGSYAIRLEQGSVDVAFHPVRRGEESFVVETSSARVEVVGTEFNVHVDELGATTVRVTEGIVRVVPRAEGPVRMVRAGEDVTVGPAVARTAAEAADARLLEPALSDPALSGPALSGPALSDPALSDPVGSPAAGQVHAVREVLPAAPTDDPVTSRSAAVVPESNAIARATPAHPPRARPAGDGAQPGNDGLVLTIETDDRYLRALTLVQEGRALEARHLLYGIARDQPTSPYYTRAWMAVAESHERENNPQSAAVAYRRATLGPPSPRAAEAQFALAGIRFRTGTREAAIVEYARYLRTYPNGAHASLARAKLCELSEQSYCGN